MEIKLTFDDVLLVPQHSEIIPSEVDLATEVISPMKIPVFSAAMDTVTESRLAIAIARLGGVGVVHKNMSWENQALEVKRVKNAQWAFIRDPVTVRADMSLEQVKNLLKERGVGGAPVTESNGKVVGMLTSRDLILARDLKLGNVVKDVMTTPVITLNEDASREECLSICRKHRIEKLPIVDKSGKLVGLRTLKDMLVQYPMSNQDELGRLRVASAVGVAEYERIEALVDAGVDFLVIDSAHGHSQKVLDTVREARRFNKPIIAGNVATAAGALALAKAGASAVKVGIGAGSICTTRIVAGIGIPQLAAIMDVVKGIGKSVPIIADGGIRGSGDVVKALAAGASAVMLGSLLAGTEESPGETIHYQGRAYKYYRGMGSLPAMMAGSRDRYFQSGKMVAEGVEARVPYRGSVENVLGQILGGVRSGMGYLGAKDLGQLSERAEFVRITNAGVVESAPHDVTVVAE